MGVEWLGVYCLENKWLDVVILWFGELVLECEVFGILEVGVRFGERLYGDFRVLLVDWGLLGEVFVGELEWFWVDMVCGG